MHHCPYGHVLSATLSLPLLLVCAGGAQGQGRGNQDRDRDPVVVEASFFESQRARILEYYATTPRPDLEALPPGIRRNLARGKAIPPGIAKKSPPAELLSIVTVPEPFELVEVGLDLLLVEVATGIIHDVLIDVIR